MNKAVLDRYSCDSHGNIIIDVTAHQVEELYNDFDRSAPYLRRDLEEDLVEYLIDCAKEVRPKPFQLRFSLVEYPDADKQARVRRSIKAYFLYLAEREQQSIVQLFSRAGVLFAIGMAILFLSVWCNQVLGEERSIVEDVFAEGLIIAAWVSIWESLAILLLEWFPHRRYRHLYHTLAASAVSFRAIHMEIPDQPIVIADAQG